MSTTINTLHTHKISVLVWYDGDGKFYNVDVIDNNLPDDADTLISGYTGIKQADEAEFLARAWIDGFNVGNKRSKTL